jgi:ABC-type antimicrobial peptide transport system permease subunit
MAEVARSGLVASGAGLLVGMILALLAVRVLQRQLYGVRVYDPVTFTAVPLLLGLIAITATFVPSLRIAKIDPAETLREE